MFPAHLDHLLIVLDGHRLDLLLNGSDDLERLCVPIEVLAPPGQPARSLVALGDPRRVENLRIVDTELSNFFQYIVRNVIFLILFQLL